MNWSIISTLRDRKHESLRRRPETLNTKKWIFSQYFFFVEIFAEVETEKNHRNFFRSRFCSQTKKSMNLQLFKFAEHCIKNYA